MNKDTEEQNQEKEEEIALEENVSQDIEENDSIEAPEEISQEETCLLYTSPSPRDS